MHGAAPDSRGLHGPPPQQRVRRREERVSFHTNRWPVAVVAASAPGWLEFVEGGLCSFGILALVPSPGLWCRLTVAKVLGPLLSIPGGPTQALPLP